MSRAVRWAVVVLVLAVAAVVALWPRDAEPPADQQRTAAAKDLGPAREKAALDPCPRGEGGPAVLRGVTVTCLADGQPVDVGAALPGKALVNFWATWCVPCHEELRVLEAYARQPGAVPVLTVLVNSKEGDGLELLTKLGVRLPAVFSEADAVRRALGSPPHLPKSYLVGADGAVAEVTRYTVLTSVDQVREVVG
ncbi:Thiol-disulfide oxidoreductase ResA [Actinosynnema sp. ALI-1.44]